MPKADFTEGLHVERHRNGSVRARGRVVDGQPDGYGEWFRLDGTNLSRQTTPWGWALPPGDC
jgi:hypothetical protein